MRLHITSDRDRLDAICHTHYGRTESVVEAVLEANPGLADAGPVLRAGIEIILPDLDVPIEEGHIRLWS